MSALPSLLCRVQALYRFESSDPSSLGFEEGDYIDVLTKLSSGWWDGCCNGNRGWFPSNYVKIIQDCGSTGLVSPKQQGPKNVTKRISSGLTDLFDDDIQHNNTRTSLPPNWSIQNKEDGSANYYFNTVTGEMRSTYPCDDFYDGGAEESDEDSATSIDSNSRSESVLLNLNYLPSTTSTNEQQQQTNGKWIQRNTPQEPPFFYNLSTQETMWHADSQEHHPQGLITTKVQQQQPTTANVLLGSCPSFDSHDTMTWTRLSIHVTFSINNLITSVKNTQRSLYKNNAAIVVEAIRFMLVASGTISKESLYIRTNGILRSHHRLMMANMSKLVLSCQLCADGTVTDGSKLVSDCHELLLSVHNFISTCESIAVEVNHVDPMMLLGQGILGRQDSIASSSAGMRAKYELQLDLIENVDAYGASMQESMESLMANLTRRSESRCSLAVLLFTQYLNFGSQNGQFLSIIEDVDFETVIESPLMNELAMAKQKLYDGLGVLFFKMQTMTDESISMEQVISEMQQAAQSIIDAIKLVCDHMADLVTEKISSQHTSSSSSSTSIKESSSFSDLLKDGATSSDLSLNSPPQLQHRSYSLTTEGGIVNSSKLPNCSSAPVADRHHRTGSLVDTIKNRAHTLTEAQSKHTTAKLKQFFGDDVPMTTPTPSTTESAPDEYSIATTLVRKSTNTSASSENDERFLQSDYSPNEISFAVDGSVKGGTLRALVERMTLHDYLDMNFNNTFLLTYRSFCTSMEILELLEARYNIEPPDDLQPDEIEIWIAKKQKLIRLRVFNVFKIWLEQYYYEEDSIILNRLLFFTNTRIKDTLSLSAYQLERLIHKRKEACTDLKKLVITQQLDSPDPILPRNLKKFRLLDLDATEMARQLTLMDFKLYSSIKPVECLDKAWSRDVTDGVSVAHNIQASIDYCNQITTWVSDEILSQREIKKRSMIIKYWVNVAERCRLLNNFNTCMAILSAFDNSAVGRLKRTWEMIGARSNHIVAHIRKLMGANRNFNQYRALIHSVNPPCIPFLGIYLQDLTFIEDGNPNLLKTPKDLINFAKRAKTAEVIREMQQYQSMGYQFRPVEEIQTFVMESLHSTRDEDQLYKESLKLEPKERDDEKITRLLQESGFL